jgi:hypothetical protein
MHCVVSLVVGVALMLVLVLVLVLLLLLCRWLMALRRPLAVARSAALALARSHHRSCWSSAP